MVICLLKLRKKGVTHGIASKLIFREVSFLFKLILLFGLDLIVRLVAARGRSETVTWVGNDFPYHPYHHYNHHNHPHDLDNHHHDHDQYHLETCPALHCVRLESWI